MRLGRGLGAVCGPASAAVPVCRSHPPAQAPPLDASASARPHLALPPLLSLPLCVRHRQRAHAPLAAHRQPSRDLRTLLLGLGARGCGAAGVWRGGEGGRADTPCAHAQNPQAGGRAGGGGAWAPTPAPGSLLVRSPEVAQAPRAATRCTVTAEAMAAQREGVRGWGAREALCLLQITRVGAKVVGVRSATSDFALGCTPILLAGAARRPARGCETSPRWHIAQDRRHTAIAGQRRGLQAPRPSGPPRHGLPRALPGARGGLQDGMGP